MEKLEIKAKNMSRERIEVKIQYYCELMHEAYLRRDEATRNELRIKRDIYQRAYDNKTNRVR